MDTTDISRVPVLNSLLEMAILQYLTVCYHGAHSGPHFLSPPCAQVKLRYHSVLIVAEHLGEGVRKAILLNVLSHITITNVLLHYHLC